MKCSGLRAFILAVAALTVSATPAGAQSGVREVSATERGVILLQTRLRYTTMVVLPTPARSISLTRGLPRAFS